MTVLTDSRYPATYFLRFFNILLLLALTGCSDKILDNSPLIKTVSEATNLVFNGLENEPVTRQQVDEIPYASMLVKVGRGGWGLVILINKDGDKLTWISADKAIIVTENGRITKTSGFGLDLDRTVYKHALSSSKNVKYIDLSYRNAFSTPVYITRKTYSPEIINILDNDYQVIKWEEKLESPNISVKYGSWSAKNVFYVDATTGKIWQSAQYPSPDLPIFYTKLTKPAD